MFFQEINIALHIWDKYWYLGEEIPINDPWHEWQEGHKITHVVDVPCYAKQLEEGILSFSLPPSDYIFLEKKLLYVVS